MPSKVTETRLRKALRKTTAPQTGWTGEFDAIVGRVDGTVATSIPGVIYVRHSLNGQVLAVYAGGSRLRALTQVEVGQRVDQPGIWQIKRVKESFAQPASGSEIGFHAPQHQFPAGADIGWWNRKQVLAFSVLVKDADAFIVRVYGGVFNSANGVVKVAHQLVDLSSYVELKSAQYVSIETDDDGLLSVNDSGTDFGSPLVANEDYIPVPGAGKYMIAYVMLHAGMTELSNSDISVPMPLGFNASGYLTEVLWGDIGGTLSDQADLQAALDLKLEDAPSDGETYGRKDGAWEVITIPDRVEIVMEDGVTFPPVPITNEEGDDWIYSD